MDTIPQDKINLFEGYLRGNLSNEREAELANWIKLSDNNYQIFKNYIGENQLAQPHSIETIQSWQKLRSKIIYHSSLSKSRRIINPFLLKIAAIVIIALLSGFFANQYFNEKQFSNVLNEVIIPNGKNAQIILSDGTKVDLNAGTHFKYPAVFSKKNRKVIMNGEAFFNVAKDKSHPFIIETPRFNVKVTGTAFNLNTYSEDEINSLTLHTGEVTILNNGHEFKVHPGEKYAMNTRTGKSRIEKADLNESGLWANGVVVIENANLEEICKILERRFDVQIRISNEKYKRITYKGEFKQNETLEDALNMIIETSPLKFSYELNKTKKEVTIK